MWVRVPPPAPFKLLVSRFHLRKFNRCDKIEHCNRRGHVQLDRRNFLKTWLATSGLVAFDTRDSRAKRVDTAAVFPWESLRRLLQSRYPELRRHFVFEYYPWYSNDPYRHWQQWGRIPPADLAGTSMPLLGAYDSRAAAVLEQHARWIIESGIGVVNLSWWRPGSFSDSAVSLVMDVMHAHDIKVAFHLEPYGAERAEQLPTDVRYLLRKYGDKRRWDCFYLNRRANGIEAPVFKLFATTLPSHQTDCHGVLRALPDYADDDRWRWATDRVREEFADSFPNLLLLSDDVWNTTRVRAAGFDGIANYDPVLDTSRWLDLALEASRLKMLFSFNVNPGLDMIKRRMVEPGECYEPHAFVPTLADLDWALPHDRERAAKAADQRITETFEYNLWLQIHPWLGNVDAGFFLTYITSFNEWHEGTQFEPMRASADLTPPERAFGYHNPEDGAYRLRRLTELTGHLMKSHQRPPKR